MHLLCVRMCVCVCVCVGGVRKCVRACVCMNVHECVCVSGVGGRKSEWVIELFIIFVYCKSNCEVPLVASSLLSRTMWRGEETDLF